MPGVWKAIPSDPAAPTCYSIPGSNLTQITPGVGDVVFVARGTGGLRSDRVVLGKLAV